MWADGIYVKAGVKSGLESTKAALLVLIAGLADGSKVVLAVESGHRESTESWAEIQRCWSHKLRNVVDAVPLKQQPDVQAAVQRIAAAESVADAEHERQAFHRAYRLRCPKASERLDRDWARMRTDYQFPKEHWRHQRTTNVVELPFAAVRLRTSAAKRFK